MESCVLDRYNRQYHRFRDIRAVRIGQNSIVELSGAGRNLGRRGATAAGTATRNEDLKRFQELCAPVLFKKIETNCASTLYRNGS